MFRRIACLFLMGAVMSGTAWAHSLTVTASASCVNGAPVISYTATSWCAGAAGSGCNNPVIDILFDGVKVDSGAFTVANNGQFSGQKPAPSATTSVDVTAVATGTWDDGFASGQTSVLTVTIPTDCSPGTGRFTGGGKQVAVGVVTVTKGFEVDCDLHKPSNNLEINWSDTGGTHQFHMLTFDSAVCTLNGNPAPPKAPVNTIVASGTGRYDGVVGFTVQFTLIDNGEPGVGNDEAGFLVFETLHPSNVVLNVPVATITGGNIQAHVDQK